MNQGDYVFIFESQGTNFLMEEIVCEHYMPGEHVTYFHGTGVQVFLPGYFKDQMGDEGLARTPDQTKSQIAALEMVVDRVISELPTYKAKEDFTQSDALYMLADLAEVARRYAYFDYCYWDKVYEQSDTNSSFKEMAELVQNFKNVVRVKMNLVYFEGGYQPLLVSKMSRLTGIPEKTLENYAASEIVALFDGTRVAEATIAARQQKYVITRNASGVTEIFTGQKAETFMRPILAVSFPDSLPDVLAGKTAHGKGKVRGRVKIIVRDFGDPTVLRRSMDDMEKGDILVSTSTDPDLMDAFRKAAAVVTDAGGLLSHAAITARELNIPCLVGTGRASKVLKDGDMVEVDVEKGVVKKV